MFFDKELRIHLLDKKDPLLDRTFIVTDEINRIIYVFNRECKPPEYRFAKYSDGLALHTSEPIYAGFRAVADYIEDEGTLVSLDDKFMPDDIGMIKSQQIVRRTEVNYDALIRILNRFELDGKEPSQELLDELHMYFAHFG